MPHDDLHDDTATAHLLGWHRALLEQALALVACFEAPGAPPFAELAGPHLRHVIEHHEALLFAADGVVDYDDRPRDRELERLTSEASVRLRALQAWLAACPPGRLAQPLRVRGRGGLAGEFGFELGSSFGRELAFVASHAVHHFALLQGHCARHGLPLSPHFGKAPATVAHERRA